MCLRGLAVATSGVMTRQSIIVIDDQEEMRDGLQAFLSAYFEVRCVNSALDFLNAAKAIGQPDCILLDLRMPVMDGHDLLVELKAIKFNSPVIFMSGDAEKSDILQAWHGGAADFILKPFSGAELKSCIDKLLNAPARGQGHADPAPSITRREAQVLVLWGQGLKQHEVAERLGLSLRTVKMYRGSIKDKLELNSLVDIARFCDSNEQILRSLIGDDSD